VWGYSHPPPPRFARPGGRGSPQLAAALCPCACLPGRVSSRDAMGWHVRALELETSGRTKAKARTQMGRGNPHGYRGESNTVVFLSIGLDFSGEKRTLGWDRFTTEEASCE
jgi:hypothetical protein